jgi:hypothetical protein
MDARNKTGPELDSALDVKEAVESNSSMKPNQMVIIDFPFSVPTPLCATLFSEAKDENDATGLTYTASEPT